MAGGGALNKIFPGYKDKIWARLPEKTRLSLLTRWYLSDLKAAKSLHSSNTAVKRLNKLFDRFKPAYNHRSPAIDYKKQRARGTLLEGLDYVCKPRLHNFMEPYSSDESETRQGYRRQSLSTYLAVAFGATILYNWWQRRPVAWCSDLDPPKSPVLPFWFKGALHSHDIGSVRRGFEVYRQICATCHSVQYLKFRNLVGEVYPERRVKEIAAEYEVEDGPNDDGEMYMRPGILTDPIPNPYPNAEAARFANNGAIPPDLTLMAAARKGGPDYIFALLTGYCEPPEGVEVRQGLYFNSYFPGGSTAMAPPLEDGAVDYEDGTPATVSQMAKDVCNFLTWAADPTHDERKNLCIKLICGASLGAIAMSLWYRFLWAYMATSRIKFPHALKKP